MIILGHMQWYGHVLRREEGYVGNRVMVMEVSGGKKGMKTKAEVVGQQSDGDGGVGGKKGMKTKAEVVGQQSDGDGGVGGGGKEGDEDQGGGGWTTE